MSKLSLSSCLSCDACSPNRESAYVTERLHESQMPREDVSSLRGVNSEDGQLLDYLRAHLNISQETLDMRFAAGECVACGTTAHALYSCTYYLRYKARCKYDAPVRLDIKPGRTAPKPPPSEVKEVKTSDANGFMKNWAAETLQVYVLACVYKDRD